MLDEIKKALTPGQWKGLGIAVVLLLIFAVYQGLHPAPSKPRNPCDDGRLELFARNAIKDGLKNPDGAEFGDTRIRKDGANYRVWGWVQSTNSFGATIRSRYVVRLSCDGAIRLIEKEIS